MTKISQTDAPPTREEVIRARAKIEGWLEGIASSDRRPIHGTIIDCARTMEILHTAAVTLVEEAADMKAAWEDFNDGIDAGRKEAVADATRPLLAEIADMKEAHRRLTASEGQLKERVQNESAAHKNTIDLLSDARKENMTLRRARDQLADECVDKNGIIGAKDKSIEELRGKIEVLRIENDLLRSTNTNRSTDG